MAGSQSQAPGTSQRWIPDRYAKNARFVADLGAPLLDMLDPKPGGRLVAEMGGSGNVASVRRALSTALARRGIAAAAVDPWYFPTPEEYRARLEARGFIVRSIALIPRPTPIPGDIAAWIETFGESFLFAVPDVARAALIAEVAAEVAPMLKSADGRWGVDYVRLRFAALKP